MAKQVEAALQLCKIGMSVIPIGRHKKPMVQWQKYQSEKATEDEVRHWYKKWPNINIGIVTGKISGISVLDADTEEAYNLLDSYLPESFVTPTAKTPNGKHVYFKYTNKLGTIAGLTNGLDIRNDGGCIVAPPGINSNGNKYEWLISIFESVPQKIPDMLLDVLLQFFNSISYNKIDKSILTSDLSRGGDNNHITTYNNHNNLLRKGQRDNDLFHIANCLIRGGMDAKLAFNILLILAKNCDPPFPENEVENKIKSALKRTFERDKLTMNEIREWVGITNRNFSITNASQDLKIITKEAKQKLRVYLSRLVNEGVLERVTDRDGVYRRIETDLNIIDLTQKETAEFRVNLPLDLHEFVVIRPKNTIVLAGEWEVGKTCFCLNVAKLNIGRNIPIRYISTEMGSDEIKARLKDFEPDMPYEDWIHAVEFVDAEDKKIADTISVNGLNIVDYLEIYDKFYLIGEELAKIYKKLDTGIAVISIQKDPAKEYGLGQMHSLHKPRLYVTLSRNPPEGAVVKIIKAKSWKNPKRNPRGYERNFRIVGGSKIIPYGDWYKK